MIDIKVLSSGSKGNCYRVTDGSSPILLECGMPWKEIRQRLNFCTSELAGCLVTHEHKDHSKSMSDVAKAGIDIYASPGTFEAIKISNHRIHPVRAREQFHIGTWTILPFETQHDAKEPLGFLLANQDGEKLLFATDTYYIKYLFKGLTHLMIECNYSLDILRENVRAGLVPVSLKNRILQSHMSLETVKEFLKANDLSKVREIYLLHLSDGNSDAERFKREVMELAGKPVFIDE